MDTELTRFQRTVRQILLSLCIQMIQVLAMPIRPEHRWFYPIDWRELSAVIRFRRAKGRCERCARPHGRDIYHLGDGLWFDDERCYWRNERGRGVRGIPVPSAMQSLQLCFEDLAGSSLPAVTRVVLASAHLDHDPSNNVPLNLAALCQRCHLPTIDPNTGVSAG